MDHLITLDPGTDRDAWLASRIPVITATQAAAIAGSHPYTKLVTVWNEKTDPDHDPDALRNRWLEERAANGSEREPEIIAWASTLDVTGGPRNPFIPSSALVTRPELAEEYADNLPPAATPDAYKYARDGVLVLLEAKTTQQDWEADGLPQHIYDQAQWQMYATGAVTVWIAVERTEWVSQGRGKPKLPQVIGQAILPVRPDAKRQEFLRERVEQFREWYREGIAPESDIELTAAPDFDASEEEVDAYAEALGMDALLTELEEIERRTAADNKRAAEIKAALKRNVQQYDGRRVHLIGTRRIAKLVRYWKATEDTTKLPADVRREITDWKETERMVVEPNPTWVPPVSAEPVSE